MKFAKSLINKVTLKKSPIPLSLDVEEVNQSPVFRVPSKWISKTKQLASDQRIQSYPDLNTNIYALQLLAPSRMTYLCRIVTSRNFLVPMHVVPNTIEPELKYKNLLVPRFERQKLDSELAIHYPLNLRIFDIINEEGKPGEDHVALKRVHLVGIEETLKPVGYLKKTTNVVYKIELEKLTKAFEEMKKASDIKDTNDNQDEHMALLFDEKANLELFTHTYESDSLVSLLNVPFVLKKEPELYSQVREYFNGNQKVFVPCDKETIAFVAELYRFGILVGS